MRKKFIHIILLLLMVLMITVPAVSLAWLGLDENTIVTHISGKLVVEYFHCGSGSETDPFVITRPIHYYHMVEFFQRLTNLPVVVYGEDDRTVVKFGNEYLYFQIGCPEEQLYNPQARPATDENTVYYVFDYDSAGTLEIETVDGISRGKKTTTLNMAYYGGELALMPVGTSEIPFVGQLDGKGCTISNLTVTTTTTVDVYTYDENGVPSVNPTSTTRNTCDVGVFGYVGSGGVAHNDATNTVVPTSIKNVYYDHLTIDLTGLSASSISSVVDGQPHANTSEIHNSETCYAGYIAGHLTMASLVDSVYVNNATFTGGAAAEIGFGYFGCVEQKDGTPVTTLGSEVTTLRAKGDDAGFGGSVDMNGIFTRLNGMIGNSATTVRNVTAELVEIDEVTGQTTVTPTQYANANATGDGNTVYYYAKTEDGSYYMFRRNDGTNWTAIYLFGENSRTDTKTVTTYVRKNEFSEAWYIKDGSNYLAVNGTALDTAANQTDAAVWLFDESGHLYTNIELPATITKYYLNRNGANGVQLGTSPVTVWNEPSDTGDSFSHSLYTTENSTNYYLSYENGWQVTAYSDYYLLSDGQGHYVNGNTTAVSSVSSPDASVRWHLSDPTGTTTTIFTVLNGTVYYLHGEGTLTMSTSPTTWTKDGSRYYVTVQGIRHDLIYDSVGDAWVVRPATGSLITDGAGHYLSAGTNGVSDTPENSASVWQFSSDTGDTEIFTILNGSRYYLTFNNGLTVGQTASIWSRSGDSFYLTADGKDYYLTYDNGWTAVSLTYYLIQDGNGNYLRVTGANAFAAGTAADATHFYFSNENGTSSAGTVYCRVGGTDYYLRNNNGTLQTSNVANATTWTNNGSGTIAPSGTTYELGYDGGWKLIDTTSYWTIATTDGTYLNASGTNAFTTTGTPTRWQYNNGRIYTVINGNNYYIRINEQGGGCGGGNASYTLQLSTTNSNNTWVHDNQNRYYINVGNANRYIRLNGNTWEETDNVNNATPLNIVEHNDHGSAVVETLSDTAPEVSVEDHSSSGTDVSLTGPTAALLTVERTQYQTVEKIVATTDSGYPTYFPLRLPKTTDSDYDAADPYKPSGKNTGYIISGGNFYDGSTSGTKLGDIRVSEYAISNISGSYATTGFSVSRIGYNGNYLTVTKNASDQYVIANTTSANEAVFWEHTDGRLRTLIGEKTYYLTYNNGLALSTSPGVQWTYTDNNNRLSYDNNYLKYNNGSWVATGGTQNLTLSKGTLNTVYTVDDGNIHQLTDAQKTAAYNQASLQLMETLTGSSNVYGLHFMNAEISMDHLLTAKSVSIFGQTYTDYELPEDSIDFHVIERGTINFFAGEYFTNNDAFFSLHKIFRFTSEDPEVQAGTKKVGDIKWIKEIREVYKHASLGDQANYIYLFSDGTYSNEDDSYTGATSLDPDYSSTPAFKASWITAPTGMNSNSHRLFYFEIPSNPGEYCLGSVSGKTGAYLIYLDIATNGGDSISSAISSEGNDVVDSFKVEFRDRPEVMDHTVLQFSIKAPDVADPSSFSTTVSFDPTDTAAPHSGGVYTITIVNRSGSSEPLELYVYLCDDDFNLATPFPYAYKVVYTNSTHTNAVLSTAYGDVIQVMAGFTIPASGDAAEMSYH